MPLSSVTMQEVAVERDRQDKQWGGTAHDDTHVAFDWLKYIDYQTDRAILETAGLTDERTISRYVRKRLIKSAALALAAIDSIDRRFP